jgi:hypothetical protein
MQMVGQRIPIIADKDGNIIDGHHRFKICRELGIELMGKSHSKADLADFLQMEETMNNPTNDMIAHDIEYNLL